MEEVRTVTVGALAVLAGVTQEQVRNLAKAANVGKKVPGTNSALRFTEDEVQVILQWRKDHPRGRPRKRGGE